MMSLVNIVRSLPLLFLLVNAGCNMGPKSAVVELSKSTQSKTNIDRNMHEVVVNEILPAGKYVYIKVREGNLEFWIATNTQSVQKDSTYLYSEALLKAPFESKELNRVFDTLYMVTSLVPKKHGQGYTLNGTPKNPSKVRDAKNKRTSTSEEMNVPFVGAIKIAELVANPKKYEGGIVELHGECTKINPGILNRNWIHLKDGSQDHYDLVITSDAMVPKGSKVTIRGLVKLDRDFGSGYTYDLILENGTLVE